MRARPGLGLRLVERPVAVEAALWRRLRFDQEHACRAALFNRYLPVARSVAMHEFHRRPPYGLEKSDFEQLAYSGLLEAIDRFDPLRGTPFDAFARHRIRGAISDGAAKSSDSSAQYSYRRRLEAERIRSLQQGQDSEDPVAHLSELSVALAIGFVAEAARAAQLEFMSEQADFGGYDSIAWNELRLSVLAEIERLPAAERSVMQTHYLEGVSFARIAELQRVTKGRISQIHQSACRRIRERLRRPE